MKIKAEISYISGIFNFKVKYLCFTLFPFKEKKKKNKRKKNIENETVGIEETTIENNSAEINYNANVNKTETIIENDIEDIEGRKKSKEPFSDKIDKLFEILEKVKIIWSVSKKYIAHIFKHIYIEEFVIDFSIADEDAYKAAMNYGTINAAVFNLINFIRTFFTVTIKTVDIICDFDSKDSVYDFSAKVTVKPSTIFSAVFGILFGLLINIKKLIGKNNKKQPSDKKAVSM